MDERTGMRIDYIAVFAGFAVDIMIYLSIGFLVSLLSAFFQDEIVNHAADDRIAWLTLAGDLILVFSVLIGGYIAASVADEFKVAQALCVGVLDVGFTFLQLSLFSAVRANLLFLAVKMILSLGMAGAGGLLAVFRHRRSLRSKHLRRSLLVGQEAVDPGISRR